MTENNTVEEVIAAPKHYVLAFDPLTITAAQLGAVLLSLVVTVTEERYQILPENVQTLFKEV